MICQNTPEKNFPIADTLLKNQYVPLAPPIVINRVNAKKFVTLCGTQARE